MWENRRLSILVTLYNMGKATYQYLKQIVLVPTALLPDELRHIRRQRERWE